MRSATSSVTAFAACTGNPPRTSSTTSPSTTNRSSNKPAQPQDLDVEGLLRGMYLLRRSDLDRENTPEGPGPRLRCRPSRGPWRPRSCWPVDWGVAGDVWSVTSWSELRRDGLRCDEHGLVTHPDEPSPSPVPHPTSMHGSPRTDRGRQADYIPVPSRTRSARGCQHDFASLGTRPEAVTRSSSRATPRPESTHAPSLRASSRRTSSTGSARSSHTRAAACPATRTPA